MTKTASKSEQAYQALRARIVEGRYEPGMRLVLAQLGGELGVSVVPVREAIRRLEAEGLVTFERNVGARVAEIDEREYLETVQTLSVVEGAAVMLAAGVPGAIDLDEARELNELLRDCLSELEPVQFTRLNEVFHRSLSDGCPNGHLCGLVDRGWHRLARLRRSTFSYVPERAAASVREHDVILELISSDADPREIELAVRAHRLATPNAFLHRPGHEAPADLR